MRKIVILGRSGAGKSTLAARLGTALAEGFSLLGVSRHDAGLAGWCWAPLR
jgi:adenylate kinase family enzyme